MDCEKNLEKVRAKVYLNLNDRIRNSTSLWILDP